MQNQMNGGLLGSFQSQPQQQVGGLLGGMGGAPAQQQPAGDGMQMPPEMLRVVAQLKQAEPEMQQQIMRQIVEKIQTSGQPPEKIQQAIQQLIAAVSG